MKTPQQIIQDTYDNNPKLKEQLDLYSLTLEDVGVLSLKKRPKPTKVGEEDDNCIMGKYNNDAPIIIWYSVEDDEAVQYSVSFTHPKTDESMREKRLDRIGK